MQTFSKAAYALLGATLVFASGASQAAIPVADSPLFLTVSVPPNITVTLDDSGSMRMAFVPDACGTNPSGYDCALLGNRYMKSAHYNAMYYNPDIKYPQPKDANGNNVTTSFARAWRNGFDQRSTGGLGYRNLLNQYRPTSLLYFTSGNAPGTEEYMEHFDGDATCNAGYCAIGGVNTSRRCSTEAHCEIGDDFDADAGRTRPSGDTRIDSGYEGPAYYYVFKSSNRFCDGTPTDNDCYDIVIVSATSGAATQDLNGDGATNAADADERQNFANWYSFARTRHLATQTATTLSFANLPPTARVAWQSLNSCNTLPTNACAGWNGVNVSNAISPFAGTHRTDFYNWVARLPTNNGTPLPRAMSRVGEYYRTSGENSPYDNDYATRNSGELACRRNYHVMMTDGIWNGGAIAVGDGNNDGGVDQTLGDDSTTYSPRTPYRDGHSSTLADMAFYYWASDLRGDLSNDLLPNYRDSTGDTTQNYWNPTNDPASWQHMVNFTIGLGLESFLNNVGMTWDTDMYRGSYPDIVAGRTAWPAPGNDRDANVADLWHAAVNSRGQFYSAKDPAALAVAFQSALTAITAGSGSSAALSANSTSLTGSTLVYQARFNNDNWSGDLIALPVNSDGSVGAPAWNANTRIPRHDLRKIFTHNGTVGVEFRSCSALDPTTQNAALDKNAGGVFDGLCTERLEWLRGNSANELRGSGTPKVFRNRPTTVMGDIVNSDPAYVKDVNYGYSGLDSSVPGQASYAAYVASNARPVVAGGRVPMVYVGSNDGRMYGIRGDTGAADSGVEKFSYIPGGIYGNLSQLTDPLYAHRYYVDGSMTAGDAFLNGAWATVVLGGLNAGGKTIYALDVTDPENFNASKVLWEFDAGDDPSSLGLTFSKPQIGILENGTWVAVFGNGYSSADGGAHLYVLDLATGAQLAKITARNLAGDESNGLSTPQLYDTDGDKQIDAAYAGDLHGNLWKFDLSGATPGTWGVANGRPMFTGDLDGAGPIPPQPITAQPKVTTHPVSGQLVLFGTGRYLTPDDVPDNSRQSYYGIWDNGFATTTVRSNLQAQNFDLHQTATFNGIERTVRSVTNETVDWTAPTPERGWYLDLLNGTGPRDPDDDALDAGERVVHTSIVAAGRVIFGSITPSTDPCEPGGRSWLIELKLGTGGAFSNSILDLNNDGRFDGDDTVTPNDPDAEVINAVSNDTLGISNVPTWIEDPDTSKARAYKIRTGTTGNFATEANCTHENEALCNASTTPPTPGVTRRSWIQIR